MTGRASTSSSFQYHFTYDVFLNFRGKDTRPGFTGSLYHALDQKGIHTFFDDEEIRKGDEIAPRLDRAIEESRMAICVFSKDYASSTFCLNELVKIHQSIKKNGRLVWPIFYDVEPAEVRHQKGNYGQALSVHKQDLRADEEKLQSWKLALREVANLSGTHVTPGHDYEYKTIERIVKEIFCKINRGPLHVAEYPVGLDIRFQK
ncbi:disease resistance protein Roq1-like [Prosopis cineraria]|uniref:disease resistance protein Roq1-like n=1 Tax=Prosopis cineraria TaxID=364024 RepID=UPI00240FE423|nr:disease resistance protein Roq1-like [Prosopis cineraria]XP_054811458.1 disease resistance protein Roq1-like [Prosopis cineraria]